MRQEANQKLQIDRFKEAARKLEVVESESAFDEKLTALTKQGPKGRKPKREEGA